MAVEHAHIEAFGAGGHIKATFGHLAAEAEVGQQAAFGHGRHVGVYLEASCVDALLELDAGVDAHRHAPGVVGIGYAELLYKFASIQLFGRNLYIGVDAGLRQATEHHAGGQASEAGARESCGEG